MYKLVVFFFMFVGCQDLTVVERKINIVSEDIKIDAVEKKLKINQNFPKDIKEFSTFWFENFVKVDGFNGTVKINFNLYEEVVSKIDNGKKIELKLELMTEIEKNNSKINHYFKIFESSHITGDFSIKDFENLVFDTKINLFSNLNAKILPILN